MTSSLRMLTYNTQLRSWAMQVGASPGYTIPPIDTAEDRAKILADKLRTSPFDVDVVALCEVFDEDAREILSDELRTRFPHQVTKVDYDHVEVRRNGTSEVVPLLATWSLVGQPHAISSSYRLEDGGLMLFSRFPFETRSTAGLDPGLFAMLEAFGQPVPAEIPVVNFWPYVDTEGNDGDACKGVVYARLKPSQFDPAINVFATHTQADTNVVEEHKGARAAQMKEIGAFVKACCGYPLTEDTFVCGDFNVFGEQQNDNVGIAEWATYFAHPGHDLTDQLTDLWGCHQAPGAPGARDLGHSASVRYPPQSQRLDYWLGATSPQLAAQHLSIDYDLSEVPTGHEDVSYISDHKPLRIDLARPRPNSTPEGAHRVGPPSPSPTWPMFVDDPQWLIEGQVKWYRFDEKGTYDFALWTEHADARLEVYLDTDLSRPRQQYRKESNPDFGDKFVLTSAPFFVKVQPLLRTGEMLSHFRAHKHTGSAPWDAIQLAYGDTVEESFPTGGQRLNDDFPSTDWDDADTKWFRLDGPQVDVGRKVRATVTITGHGAPFGVALVRESGATLTLETRDGPGMDSYVLATDLARDDRCYVQVTRADGPTPGDLDVSLRAEVDISLLLGGVRGEPRMICQTETSGWGADDIELTVNVDGVELVHVDNDTIGDFDQDDVREIRQYLPQLIPYTNGVEFVVKELDDTSPDDIGRSTLPTFEDAVGFGKLVLEPGPQPAPDGTIRGALNIAVDDGVYAVQLTLAQWDETF